MLQRTFACHGTCLQVNGSYEETVRLWDTRSGTFSLHVSLHMSQVFAHLCLQVSGSYDETVRLWDTRSGTCIRELPAHSDPVTAVRPQNTSCLDCSKAAEPCAPPCLPARSLAPQPRNACGF